MQEIFTPQAEREPLPLLPAASADSDRDRSATPEDSQRADLELQPEPEQHVWTLPSDPEGVSPRREVLPCLDLSSFLRQGELALDTPLPSLSTPGGSSHHRRQAGVRSRPGTRESFLGGGGGRRSRPGTREALHPRDDGGLSRPGTRESSRGEQHAAEALATGRSGESFQMDMPSFRMTWSSTGGVPAEQTHHDTQDLRAKNRADRRRHERRSYASAKTHSYVHNHKPADQHQFFGAKARTEFFDLYNEQARVWAQEGAPRGEELRQASARTHYLSSCVRTQSTPIPLQVRSLKTYGRLLTVILAH
jgi:hypothetical protein